MSAMTEEDFKAVFKEKIRFLYTFFKIVLLIIFATHSILEKKRKKKENAHFN